MELILDIGSGNTLKSFGVGRKLIDEVMIRDSRKHKIIFKAQLFQDAPPNIPLNWDVFADLMCYSWEAGYPMTSSVFDLPSLEYLLGFMWKLPFVKIACRPDLYWLIGEIPRKIPVYVSVEDGQEWPEFDDRKIYILSCVPAYPAEISDYSAPNYNNSYGISDHTVGWRLFNRYNKYGMGCWEKHLVPEHSADNPDAGLFAVTPTELEGII